MTIKGARKVIAEAFKKDPDFRRAYVDNIACILSDNVKSLSCDISKRNRIASEIIKCIFE